MKTNLIAMSVAMFFSGKSFASEGVIISKTNFYGFGPPETRQSEECEFFADRVEITRTVGAATIKESRPLTGAQDLEAIVEDAAREKTTETLNDMCDGPRTVIAAFTAGDQTGHVLYDTGSCGRSSIERIGPSTRLLVWLINKYCPETFKIRPTN